MHPSLQELLALRDGDGAPETARHVERCDECRGAVEEMSEVAEALGELPPVPAPPGNWDLICSRIESRSRWSVGTLLGVAAAVILGLAVGALVGRFDQDSQNAGHFAAGDTRQAIEQLSSASRELELVLQDAALQSPVLSLRRAAMIVEIEDRIALVDLALADDVHHQGEGAVALWSDRVELLDALVTARGGDVGPDSFVFAINQEDGRKR